MWKAESWVNQSFFSFWFWEPDKSENIAWYYRPWKNRYARLFFLQFQVLLSGSLVFSWQPFSSMLFGSLAFKNLCTDASITEYANKILDTPNLKYHAICNKQYVAVQSLYTINLSAEFICGVLAGISLDNLGPLVTGFISQILLFIGCISMIIGQTINSFYFLAVFMFGSSGNFTVFSALTAADYFPKHSVFIISLTIAMQNANTLITTLLDVWFRSANGFLTVSYIFFIYLMFVLIPFGICYILSLPLIRLAVNPKFQKLSNNNSQIVESTVVYRKVIQEILSPEMLLFGLFIFCTTLQYNYYPVILREWSGDDIARFNGYIFPTLGIFGIIFGAVVNYTTTLPIAYFLVVLIALVYAFCLIESHKLQYLTSILFVIGSSFIYSCKFTYVEETYSPRNHGVLIGFLGLIAGITMGIIVIFLEYCKTQVIIIALLALTSLSILIVFILDIRRKNGINYKHVNKDETDCDSTEKSDEIELQGGI